MYKTPLLGSSLPGLGPHLRLPNLNFRNSLSLIDSPIFPRFGTFLPPLDSVLGIPVTVLQKWLVSVRMKVRSLASLSGLRIRCCRELRCRLAAAAAPIRSLAWELSYALGADLKKKVLIFFLPVRLLLLILQDFKFCWLN